MSGTNGRTRSALDAGEERRRRVEARRAAWTAAAWTPSVGSRAAARLRAALETPGRGC